MGCISSQVLEDLFCGELILCHFPCASPAISKAQHFDAFFRLYFTPSFLTSAQGHNMGVSQPSKKQREGRLEQSDSSTKERASLHSDAKQRDVATPKRKNPVGTQLAHAVSVARRSKSRTGRRAHPVGPGCIPTAAHGLLPPCPATEPQKVGAHRLHRRFNSTRCCGAPPPAAPGHLSLQGPEAKRGGAQGTAPPGGRGRAPTGLPLLRPPPRLL